MKGKTRVLLILVVVMAFLAIALSAQAAPQQQSAPAQAQGADGMTASKSASAREQASALDFWTHDRLAAAKPMALPMDASPAAIDEASIQNRASSGPAGFSSAGAPSADADRIARMAYAADWASGGKESAALADVPAFTDGTSQTYTSYIVNKNSAIWKTFTSRTVGRLSFTTPNGTSYCSASVVSPNNIIVTAAHCVYDTGSRNAFYSNWVFTPAYRNGNAPYGTFAYQTCWVLNSWINLSGGYSINTWADDDVAVCKMRNNSAGQSLSSVTGWLGRGWNWPYVQHVTNLGYPFNNYQNVAITDAGKYLRLCHNETFQQASEVLGGGCNWGPGISGGPWSVGYSVFEITGQVRSVNSGLFIGTQNLYGARFNSNNIVPLCTSAGC